MAELPDTDANVNENQSVLLFSASGGVQGYV